MANFFNQIVKRMVKDALNIKVNSIFNSSEYSSKGLPSEDAFDEAYIKFMKAVKELKINAKHKYYCSELKDTLKSERENIGIQNLSISPADRLMERDIFDNICKSVSKLDDDNQTNQNTTIRNIFLQIFRDAYYIVKLTPKELQEKNFIEKKITEETIKNNKCFFDFSNKNYVIQPVKEEFIPPLNIVEFSTFFELKFQEGYNTSANDEIDKKFENCKFEEAAPCILGYVCATSDEVIIKKFVSYIPDEVLPDKNAFIDFIKSIRSFSETAKMKLVYNACIDKSLLDKYFKLKREFMEQVILPECSYEEALERLSDLFVSCRMLGNLDGLIIYHIAAVEIDLIGKEEFDLRKEYGIYPSVNLQPLQDLSDKAEDLIRLISITADTRAAAIQNAMLFVKSFKSGGFDKDVEIAEYAILQLSQYTDEEYIEFVKEDSKSDNTSDTETAFEQKCMDMIEKIISENINATRTDAIEITRNMLDKAMSDDSDNEMISIYKRVIYEFKIATDEEYDTLKRMFV